MKFMEGFGLVKEQVVKYWNVDPDQLKRVKEQNTFYKMGHSESIYAF